MLTKKLSRLCTLLIFLPFACSSDGDGDGDGDTNTGAVQVEVCGDQLECGSSCVTDDTCPDGQHCLDTGSCYAECTEDVGCDGTCTSQGRCQGSRTVVVSAPTGDTSTGDILVGDDDSASGGGSSGGSLAECATSRNSGELVPVNMFVMMDNSLSMEQQNKWSQASSAMIAFFEDPSTGGLDIALRFFDQPDAGAGCNEQACANDTIDACSQPEVPLGTVTEQPGDPQESALVGAVNGQQPDVAGTPLFAALSGATQWALAEQASNADEQMVVVFVTDGEPRQEDSCPRDADSIAGVAQGAYAQGVLTYAIGLEGSNENLMNAIAAAGGSGQGIFIGSQNAERDLLNALTQIRGEVASCDIQVPSASGDQTIDTSKVNVTLTLGGDDTDLGQVMDPDDCDDLGAWYYNDDETRIQLCPAACDAVTNDPSAQIDIVLGCTTSITPVTIAR